MLLTTALCVLALGIFAVLRRHLTGDKTELGGVSERWLAEYRTDSSRPSR